MARMICHPPRRATGELTPSEEEYLESIYNLEKKLGRRVKVNELAKNLGVKDPSVVEMLQKLKNRGFVTYNRSGIKLTGPGRKCGVGVVRRHELAERLLYDVFKHDLPGVHEHACEFEHILDDELADKIDGMLGKPATCPHGNPIPTKGGRAPKPAEKSLIDMKEGEECKVMTIPEERASVERLLSLNILPRARVGVVEKLPRGAVMLQCGKTQVALSRDIASKILVGMPGRHRHGHGHRF